MKVICNRGALLEALNVTGNVVAARSPKPSLLCLKLTAADNTLTVAATDLEVAIRYTESQVQIEEPGEALLPADKLRDIVRESVDDTLAIEIAGDTANIRGQDSHFKIFTQNVADFPPVPDFEGEGDFQLAGATLKSLIGQTLFAVAKESTRYAYNGVLIAVKNKKINFVSTDTRRLALARTDLAGGEKLEKDGKSVIVPAKALSLIDKLVTNPEEQVSVQVKENQIIFHTSSATLTSNLVEGQFPPYEDVIPKDADKKMISSTADFLSAIKRASLLTTEDSKGVRLSFTKKGLVVNSRSPDSGEATINFACKFEGADLVIGFNPMFMCDALKVVDNDEISLEMTTPNRPALLRGGSNFMYVIMPVNLQ